MKQKSQIKEKINSHKFRPIPEDGFKKKENEVEKKLHYGENLSLFEKYAILGFLDSLYTYNPRWECIVEEIKTKFSNFFDFKIENEN